MRIQNVLLPFCFVLAFFLTPVSAQLGLYQVTVTTGDPSGYESMQDSGDGTLEFRIDAENAGTPTQFMGTSSFPMINVTANQVVPGSSFTGARITGYQFRVEITDVATMDDILVLDAGGDAIGNIDEGMVNLAVFPDFVDNTDPANPAFVPSSGGVYTVETMVGSTPITISFDSGIALPSTPPDPGTVFPYSMTVTVPEPTCLAWAWIATGLMIVGRLRARS